MSWWRRIKPAVHYKKTLARARIACFAQRCLRRWQDRRERIELVGIKAQWAAQKDEISTLRAQLEKMKQMYSEARQQQQLRSGHACTLRRYPQTCLDMCLRAASLSL